MNKAVLIINLGSPNNASVLSVWKFLKEFLMDGRVIDIPYLLRFFLVNFIIIPLRVLNSTKEYRKMWKNSKNAQFLAIGGFDLAENKPYEVPDRRSHLKIAIFEF